MAAEARRLEGGIRAAFPPSAVAFLAGRPFLVAASAEPHTGRVWATWIEGAPGFLEVVDGATLRIGRRAAPGDPFHEAVEESGEMGTLAIEFATRRRMKAKGRATIVPGGYELHARSIFALCPKHIRPREEPPEEPQPAGERRRVTSLDVRWRERIDAADTFFVATYSEEGGADVSHRGGEPGFVRTASAGRIVFDDYPGNNMFNTLGNLELHPKAALLFPDFATGDVLQVTGPARVVRDAAGRRIEVDVEAAVETPRAIRRRP